MPALPPEVADLRRKLSEPDFDDRMNAAADFAGLPQLHRFPRPGQASSWRLREWEGWAKDNGFVRGERGKYGDHFYHSIYRTLNFDLTTDSHPDQRRSMQIATDLRRRFIDQASVLIEVLVFLIDGWGHERVENMSGGAPAPGDVMKWLRTVVEHPRNLTKIMDLIGSEKNTDRVDCSGEIHAIVAVLRKEFGLTPKRCFELVGFSTISAEKLSTIDKQGIPYSVEQPDGLLKKLRELRDAKRQEEDVAREQREAKQREREAKLAPPQPVPATEPATPVAQAGPQDYAAQGNATRTAVMREIEGAAEVVNAAHQRLLRAIGSVQGLDFTRHAADAALAIAETAMLREQNEKVIADHRHLLEEYAALKADNVAMSALIDEAAAAPNTWLTAFSEFAQFVAEQLADNDITKLMGGIEKVREAATNAVKHAASAPKPQPANTEAATS